MKNYKIAFIGSGSIGKRHILNTIDYLNKKKCFYSIDLIRSGKGLKLDQQIENKINKIYSYCDNISDNYDMIFVSNPTNLHYETIKKYVNCTRAMFVEKPIFDRTDYDIANIDIHNNCIIYVACPLRYTNVLQYIKENVDYKAAYCIRAVSSSYLPDWRPNVDYRNTYSAHKEFGGGVSIDLIHEWDYLTHFFGFPDRVVKMSGKYSELEIDSDDLAVYLGIYDTRIIELHLDYFGKKTRREMQIFLPDESIIVDIANGKIIYEKAGTVIDLAEKRNDFQYREIEHFFDIIDGHIVNDNDITNAFQNLKVTLGEW